MNSIHATSASGRNWLRLTLFPATFAFLALAPTAGSLRAQDAGAPPPPPPAAPASGQGADNGGDPRADRRAARRAQFSPDAMLARLRDQMGVTDDAEWTLISQRIQAVFELRRAAGGFGGMMGGFRPQGGDNAGQARQRGGGSPELDALRTAINDKAPDAEVKARLERYRQVRKDSQAKLEKAQEDLRAILTVRQEALLVSFGMLP